MLSFSQTTLIFAMETSLVVFNVSSSVFQEYYTHVLCSLHIINPYSQCKSMLWPLFEIYLACESLLILFKFFVLNYIIIQKMIQFTQSTLAKPVFLPFVSIPISGLELACIGLYLHIFTLLELPIHFMFLYLTFCAKETIPETIKHIMVSLP